MRIHIICVCILYIYYIYCNSINYTYINIYVQLYISNKTPQWQGPAKPHVFSHKYHWVQQAIGIQTAARLAQLPNAAKACQTQLASLGFTGSALTHRNVPLENGRSSCTRQGGMLFKKKGIVTIIFSIIFYTCGTTCIAQLLPENAFF